MSEHKQPAGTEAILSHLVKSILATTEPLTIERVREGQSTEVYRIHQSARRFYLRLLPELDASFAPEVYVHTILRTQGLRVPEVVYFEHYHPGLQRSVMMTTEIPGQAIGYGARSADVQPVIRQAGRELAYINTIKVDKFGWIQRDKPWVDQLQAEYTTYAAWLQRDFAEPCAVLEQHGVLAPSALAAVRLMLAEAVALLGEEPPVLAHGDFDVTHIYQQHGQYTGIIDFGEIRGANQWYDLGHFQIENPDLLPALLDGYGEITPLPTDVMRRILITSGLIAVRRLGRWLARSGDLYQPDLAAIMRIIA
ncbi:MAG: aminoglycoside phosphotransferase family protein [Chloroflexi bacterium]|nr:aminoglycoside phosphotransferase family protein [Chloroflexota bacterium]